MKDNPYAPPQSELHHQAPAFSQSKRLASWNLVAQTAIVIAVTRSGSQVPWPDFACYAPVASALFFCRRPYPWLKVLTIVLNAIGLVLALLRIVTSQLLFGAGAIAIACLVILIVVYATNIILIARAGAAVGPRQQH